MKPDQLGLIGICTFLMFIWGMILHWISPSATIAHVLFATLGAFIGWVILIFMINLLNK